VVSVDSLDYATASAHDINRGNKIEEIKEEEENQTSSIENSSVSYDRLRRIIRRKHRESLEQRDVGPQASKLSHKRKRFVPRFRS